MPSYFYKELPDQVYAPNGRPLACDFVDPDGYGWIATENGYVIHQINQAIAQRIGGFVASDQASYDAALKKKEMAPPPTQQSQRVQSFQPFHLAQQRVGAGFAEAGNTLPSVPTAPKPDPIAVPTPAQMTPRTGRVAPAKAASKKI